MEFLKLYINNVPTLHHDYILLTINSWQLLQFYIIWVQSYSCIHEGVCCHVVNIAYRYMNTWYICVCNITHGHFFPDVEYVISVLLSHLLLCFAICAFGFCQIFGVDQYLLDEISHLNVCLQIKYLIPIHFASKFEKGFKDVFIHMM